MSNQQLLQAADQPEVSRPRLRPAPLREAEERSADDLLAEVPEHLRPLQLDRPLDRGPHRPGWSITVGDLRIDFVVSVVIPTLNEARNLPAVLLQIPVVDTEVIIVDGRSTDGTTEMVEELRPDARIIVQDGKGKGDALRAGFEAATGDIIVMVDADGSMSPREIPAFVEALVQGADLAKGSRMIEGAGSADLTVIRNLGNLMLRSVFNRLYRTDHSDLCYGYMAFWRRHADTLMPDCDGFEVETHLNVRAAKAGLNVTEVPSHEGRRTFGSSNLRPIRDGLRVMRTILRGTTAPAVAPEAAR